MGNFMLEWSDLHRGMCHASAPLYTTVKEDYTDVRVMCLHPQCLELNHPLQVYKLTQIILISHGMLHKQTPACLPPKI